MTKLTKKERHKVLQAVNYGWTADLDLFRSVTRTWPRWLSDIAWDCLTVMDSEPWRGFDDVLNEVLDY